MTNHPNRNGKFELTFVGGTSAYAQGVLGSYKRKYDSFEAAQDAAFDLLTLFEEDGTRAAHSAVIYGPDCGRDGHSVV